MQVWGMGKVEQIILNNDLLEMSLLIVTNVILFSSLINRDGSQKPKS
jgi:hypothetical protein